jgi:hypothetical protein
MREFIYTVIFVMLTLLALSPNATFAKGQLLTITKVAVDFSSDTLTITGKDFDYKDISELRVSLGEFGDITVLCGGPPSPTATVIICDFQGVGGLPDDGDYRLIVSTSDKDKDKQSDNYDLTIGAVGLRGPPGPPGPKGNPGASNRQRLLGDVGELLPDTEVYSSQVSCPAGQLLTGCSSECKISSSNCHLMRCAGVPSPDLQTCYGQAQATNPAGAACLVNVRAIAICADP